ncbi:MAG: hypothetical protein RI922_947 [Bacteroidota bacterium]|jgi:hypothetical protein
MNSKLILPIFLLTIIPVVWLIIFYLQVGDWISGPAINMLILPPMYILQLMFFIRYKKSKHQLNLNAQLIISSLSIVILFYYISVHKLYP